MNHQRTQLALLISLIGIGVAPNAHASANLSARLDDRAIDVIQRLPGVTCDELEAATLPSCGANADLVWQAPRDTLDLPATAGVRVLYTTARDDWAPGELASLGHETPRGIGQKAATKPVEARHLPRQTTRKSTGKTSAGREFAQAPALARMKAQSLVHANVVVASVELLKAEPPVAEPSSSRTDRLQESLAAVLHDAPSNDVPVAFPVEAGAPQILARIHDGESAHIEQARVAVDTESSQVLRNLGAILSAERDEVGAIRPEPSKAVVTTQTGKVMAMLGEIVAAQPPVEDGPARRLRKLAARAAKAEAKADADVAAAVAAEVVRVGVDLMLPLELPIFAAALPADDSATPPLIELAVLPVDAQFAATATATATAAAAHATPAPAAPPARANPFGGRQVAIAESSLDRVRGGFGIDGLTISFGIERAVYVNGALVTTTSLNVSDLGRITAGRGTTAFDVGTIGLIQSGAGNVVSPAMISAGSVGTVIQNTLDGQKIQNVTIINATSNSLGLLKGINLQSSLRAAVIDSLRR